MRAVLSVLLMLAMTVIGRAEDSARKDGWSETVNGLRARLVFGEGHVFNGTRLPEVYLELHNAVRGYPMEFDLDAGKSLHFDLRSADGKPGPQPNGVAANGPRFGPFHITLPRDSTFRFAATWRGYGIRQDAGTALGFESAFWIIPATDPTAYFLSAVLEVPETPRGLPRPSRWHGIIRIPAVKVPVKQ